MEEIDISKLTCLGKDEVVIVEGKKDKIALEKLGVRNIITLNKPLYLVVEDVASRYKKAVILTDLDKEGMALYGRLSSDLQSHGVSVDNSFRNSLFRNTKLRQIEGIANYPKLRGICLNVKRNLGD